LTDASKLGAFAYCIEATESLNQVTTFFLQQRINWQDKEHAVNWLTRFKELDLRLVHWKLFLPPRWKDSNISPVTEVVDMDPNLTLAHITHNTSMILLHHPIAHPPREWKSYVALPKECSSQTCELAAVETSNIVSKFLTHRVVFVNTQFAFCAFVAAKALLFESQATARPVRHEFGMLIRSLWEISARWRTASSNDDEHPLLNQAGIYARHLECLYDACQRDSRYRFDLYDHSCQEKDSLDMKSPAPNSTPSRTAGTPAQDRWQAINTARPSHTRSAAANSSPTIPHLANILYTNTPQPHSPYQPLQHSPNGMATSYMGPPPRHIRTSSFDQNKHPYSHPPPGPPILRPQSEALGDPTSNPNGNTVQDESLLSLSDALMDSQFLGMDRVITFEDANFLLPGDGFRWQ
jgi:hypothetical protein